jgi:hypothetical protein
MLECGDIFLIHGLNEKFLSPMVRWESDADDKDKGRWVISVFGDNLFVKSSLESIVHIVSRRSLEVTPIVAVPEQHRTHGAPDRAFRHYVNALRNDYLYDLPP